MTFYWIFPVGQFSLWSSACCPGSFVPKVTFMVSVLVEPACGLGPLINSPGMFYPDSGVGILHSVGGDLICLASVVAD